MIQNTWPNFFHSWTILKQAGRHIPEYKKKQITRWLRFIDSARFMLSSLDSLSRNLVGANGIVCEGCRNEAELTNINENYVAHGTCGKC